MKIKIISSSNKNFWYDNRIGQTFDVVDGDKGYYMSPGQLPGGYYIIQKCDAVKVENETYAFCLICGCDDKHACIDSLTDKPCTWILLDREKGYGVCSECLHSVRGVNKTLKELAMRGL
jgi:hypothetical protein